MLQPGHRAAKRLGHAGVKVAGHLADLHQCALHRAELLGHLLSRPQSQVVAQLAAARHRREDELGRTGGVAAADAQRQPRQRRAAADSRPCYARRRPHARMRSSIRRRASITPGLRLEGEVEHAKQLSDGLAVQHLRRRYLVAVQQTRPVG